jgi:hypothetical protein
MRDPSDVRVTTARITPAHEFTPVPTTSGCTPGQAATDDRSLK